MSDVLTVDERIARIELGLTTLAAHVTANYPLRTSGHGANPFPEGIDALQELHAEAIDRKAAA